jgi:hypothetical protein
VALDRAKLALGFFVASILSFMTALFADSGRLAAASLGGICLGLAVANFKRGRDAGNFPPDA